MKAKGKHLIIPFLPFTSFVRWSFEVHYLMFKKSRYKPYQKRRQPPSPLILLLALLLILILLELLARVAVSVAGKNAELAAYEGEPTEVTAYRLKFLDQNQQTYGGLPNSGRLVAKRRLSVGYQLAGKQQSKFWRINEQGFRDDQPVSQAKPKDEIRIFILGGSTAFGQMSSNNATTFAHKLEGSLNIRVKQQKASPEKFRPDFLPYYKPERVKALALPLRIREGNYRVINAAVPGYTSGNELAGLALQILPYQPDAIVVLNGYADLMLPSTENETDIPYIENFLNNAAGHLWFELTQDMNRWLNQTYLVKATQYWVLKPQPSVDQLTMAVSEESVPLAQRLPANTTELERRVKRYQNHQTQMVRLTAAAQIPLVLVVQPEITGRSANNLSLRERELLSELGSTYTQRVQAGYGQIDTKTGQLQRSFPENVKVLNFYKLYRNFPGQAFSDAIHLTDEANTVLADRLYKTFLELPRLQIQPAKQPQ